MAHHYVLRVTAGPNYDLADHSEVPVNTSKPVKVSTDLMDVELNVRVQNYRGLPRQSPSTSPYFSSEPHARNGDQYSIAVRFTPKRPPTDKASGGSSSSSSAAGAGDSNEGSNDGDEVQGISATDLQWGNDFDHPIRDRLPPGFGTAMNIVKWWIDPGLEGDPYSDSPYLYGPGLSSFNAIHVGEGVFDEEKGGLWFEEGGDEDGLEARRRFGAPVDSKGRMKWALRADNKAKWVWEYGRTYGVDFFNPYLDFSEFALRLPGFNLPIIRYWDGQGLRPENIKRSHQLRYVLRNRTTKDVYLVVLFTLYLKEDVNEDGSLKPEALKAYTSGKTFQDKSNKGQAAEGEGHAEAEEHFDEEKVLEEARRSLSHVDVAGTEETSADDVD